MVFYLLLKIFIVNLSIKISGLPGKKSLRHSYTVLLTMLYRCRYCVCVPRFLYGHNGRIYNVFSGLGGSKVLAEFTSLSSTQRTLCSMAHHSSSLPTSAVCSHFHSFCLFVESKMDMNLVVEDFTMIWYSYLLIATFLLIAFSVWGKYMFLRYCNNLLYLYKCV